MMYIMISILQRDLNEFKDLWNTHRIRKQKDIYLPDGRPDHMYHFPEKYEMEHCGKLISL